MKTGVDPSLFWQLQHERAFKFIDKKKNLYARKMARNFKLTESSHSIKNVLHMEEKYHSASIRPDYTDNGLPMFGIVFFFQFYPFSFVDPRQYWRKMKYSGFLGMAEVWQRKAL